MSVRWMILGGYRRIGVDKRFVREDGTVERFKRAAEIQTIAGGKAEQDRLIAYFDLHGTIQGFRKPKKPPKTPKKSRTWEQAVVHYRDVDLPLVEESTRDGYELVLSGPNLRHWDGWCLEEIDADEVKLWAGRLKKRKLSGSTQRNCHIVLRLVLGSVGHTVKFPPPPKAGKKRRVPVSPEDVAKLLGDDLITAPYKLAFALGAYAGLRSGEIKALKRGDVDLEAGTITVRKARYKRSEKLPKSCHERTIPIAEPLLPLLLPRLKKLADADHVVTRQDGEPMGHTALVQSFRRARRRIGVKGTVHGLRHAFGTMLAKRGVPVGVIQGMMGHADVRTTIGYIHSSDTDAARAIAATFGKPANTTRYDVIGGG